MLVIFGKSAPALAVLALLAAAPRTAAAEASPEEALARAREQLDHQDYREVLRAAEPLCQDTSAPLRVRLGAFELTGVSHLLMRRQSRAQEAFEALLALDPGYELSDASYPPRISEFFDMVRQSLGRAAEIGVRLEGGVPSAATAGEPLELTAQIGEGRERVDSVVLLVRTNEGEDYEEHPFECASGMESCTVTTEVPAGVGTVELYVEVRAPSGHRLGGVGTATAPSRIDVSTPEGGPIDEPIDEGDDGGAAVTPWYATWWFWTAIGVGVAAVATGVTLGVVYSEPPEPAPGTMGTARLP